MKFLSYIEEFNTVSVCLRLFLATFFGGCIGLERGSHGQAAGIRTFALVCLGAALAMVTDEYLVGQYQTGDPARLAAQVISGIGFLGVGTIIVTGRNYVRGLTTAAGLWTTACLGIAIGSGFLVAGVIGFLLIFFVMTVLSLISHRVDDYAKGMLLYMEVDKEQGIQAVYHFVQEHHIRIASIEKQKKQPLQKSDAVLTVKLHFAKRQNHQDVLQQMNELETIHYIEEIR